jgi:hypothetical protein
VSGEDDLEKRIAEAKKEAERLAAAELKRLADEAAARAAAQEKDNRGGRASA